MEQKFHNLMERVKDTNPKILNQIDSHLKKYKNYIKNAAGFYQLQTLAMEVESLNLKISDNIIRFFKIYKYKILDEIDRKIRMNYEADSNPQFFLRDIKKILSGNNINKNISMSVIKAITHPMLINLSIEDFYIIAKNADKLKAFKVKYHSTEINKIKDTLKLKLKNAKSAIIILYCTQKTTLSDLKNLGDIIINKLPVKSPLGYSFGIKKNLKKTELLIIVGSS